MLLSEKFSGLPIILLRTFMNFTIGTKMLIVYIIVILVPTFLYSIDSYVKINNNMINMYVSGNQQLLEQSYSNLKGEISRMESVYQLFQYNTAVTDLLSGYFTTESEEIYAYLKDIEPLFEYGKASNKPITDIAIYKYRKSLVNFKYYILDMEDYDGDPGIIYTIPKGNGQWILENSGGDCTLRYFRKFYSKDFIREVGFIRISVKGSSLLNMLNIAGDNGVFLFRYENQWFVNRGNGLYRLDAAEKESLAENNPVVRCFFESDVEDMGNSYTLKGKAVVNSLDIKELRGKAVILTPTSSIIGDNRQYTPMLYLALLLVFLSFVYYAIITLVTRRMVRLARHIRRINHDNLCEFGDTDYKDEIGELIRSYNEMILRIGSLVNSVNIAELKKREADFFALQAQIKPHFIYNSLETIRMLAEANGATTVADLTYNLGSFIRYNLSKRKDETLLKDEIENVRNYLKIYKVSMADRLEFNISINCEIGAVKCPGFILQPLVENSLHHGLASKRGKCAITLAVQDEEEFILVIVKDNGIGIPGERLKTIKGVLGGALDPSELLPKGNGIGIVNVNERIKTYFGGRSGLSVDSVDNCGTTCVVRFEK